MQISKVFAPVVALLSLADATAPASIANLASNTDAHLKSVAGALTDLLKTNGTAQASNTSDIVKTIKDLLEKNMKGHVLSNFNKSLQAIEDSKNEFVKCRQVYEKADPVRFPATSLLQANSTPWYEAYFQAYSQCKDIKGQIEVLTLARSGPGRYNLTHRCTDILGTAERCFKECDGHIEDWLCYIDSFGEDQAAKLSQCVEKDYTKHPEVLALTIEPGFPEEKLSAFSCPTAAQPGHCNASETPGTEEFDQLHYSHLPTGLANCPALHCQDVCGFVNVKAMNASTSTLAPLIEKTTVKSQCFKKADSQAVFWDSQLESDICHDLGSAQDVGTVSATPSAGVASIKVYLTSSGPGEALAPSNMCGTITHTSNSVECSSKGAGRYLAMEPFVDGTCVFGSCTQSLGMS
eukprot:Skav224987  [mRNA]  locus=scaffold560:259855:263859:- [translate_table: standard]